MLVHGRRNDTTSDKVWFKGPRHVEFQKPWFVGSSGLCGFLGPSSSRTSLKRTNNTLTRRTKLVWGAGCLAIQTEPPDIMLLTTTTSCLRPSIPNDGNPRVACSVIKFASTELPECCFVKAFFCWQHSSSASASKNLLQFHKFANWNWNLEILLGRTPAKQYRQYRYP